MAFKTLKINPLNLVLDEKNPRFVTKNSNNLTQNKIMEYLINYEEVIQLAKDINNYGGLIAGERILVILEDNKYKVLEGNRRTAAMHLLLNPSCIPNNISKVRKKQIPQISSVCSKNISIIEVDLVDKRDEAIYSLTKRHIDGIKKWSQISKMFFYKNLFENGKNLKEIKEFTGESTGKIKKVLKQYNFLRLILDNYVNFFPSSTISGIEIETDLNTDFIIQRVYSFICDELKISFTNKTYEIDLSKYNKDKRNLLIKILVKISFLYWGEDGHSSTIDSRKLNTQSQIKNYFLNPNTDDQKVMEINKLIMDFKRIPDISNRSENKNNQTSIEPNNNDFVGDLSPKDCMKVDNNKTSAINTNNTSIDKNEENDSKKNDASKSETPAKSNYKPRDPSTYNKLTSAFKLSNYYKKNQRINKTKQELSNIEYKKFPIATMYLIRSLLESYVNEYIDLFASFPKSHKYKMSGISASRDKRKGKKLQDLIHNHIKHHLKEKIKDYAETYELIDVTFSNNNKASAMKIINFYIHSNTHYPDQNEILEAWSKISTIINTMDKLIAENSGQ